MRRQPVTAAPRHLARPGLRTARWGVVAATIVAGAAVAAQPATPPAGGPAAATLASAATGVAWRPGGSDAEVDAALAEARQRGVPVLLYWGASWCPPCNRLKSTLFPRADFVAMAGTLVPVYVDGDRPGAQRIGARFKVSAYPTLVLLSPLGREITRLPGEAEADQVLRTVQAGLAGGRPVAELVADARAGRPLDRNAWRMLGFYSWETASAAELPAKDRPAVLADVARAAAGAARAGVADDEVATRLMLKAVAAAEPPQALAPDAAATLQRLLADPAAVRRHADTLVYGADAIARHLAPKPGPERQAWVGRLDGVLTRLQDDPTLARLDRLAALATRVDLARLDEPDAVQPKAVPTALAQAVADRAAAVDRELRDPHERQAAIPLAADMLARVGRWDASAALLQANLAKVGEPYALMSQLAGQARRQGRTDEALRWSTESFERSRGPATRLQWGAAHLARLAELAPDDAARIEAVAAQLLREAAADRGALHERSGRSLQRVGRTLATWSEAKAGTLPAAQRRAVLERLAPARDALCAAQPEGSAERASCSRLWAAPATSG